LTRDAVVPISELAPRSCLSSASEASRELQADNDEFQETNRQLIAALEEIQSLNTTLQSVNEALHTSNVELRSELELQRRRAADVERMLDAIGVAAVLLDEGLEVRNYNASASRFFTLERRDVGKPIARIRHDLAQTSLLDLCREAQDTGEPLERVVTPASGGLVSLEVREIELGGAALGLMLTVTDIVDLASSRTSRAPDPLGDTVRQNEPDNCAQAAP
jgi:two-component system CheB/CheR fusion protein